MTRGRALAIWSGCFVLIAVTLALRMQAPLVPVLAAGAVTLVITLLRSTRS